MNLKYIIFLILFVGLVFLKVYPQSISSTELIENAENYNGKTIVYRGEVIGDIMIRKNHCWLNINDGENTIGVWIEKKLIENINYTGSYKFKGDEVEVYGTFNSACLEHGGDLDIHAYEIKILRSGYKKEEHLSFSKIKLTAIFVVVFFLLLTIYLIKINYARGAS
ncbi:MAG: DNA-binding protein [Candidatus Aenigmatarchaeota archaeon]